MTVLGQVAPERAWARAPRSQHDWPPATQGRIWRCARSVDSASDVWTHISARAVVSRFCPGRRCCWGARFCPGSCVAVLQGELEQRLAVAPQQVDVHQLHGARGGEAASGPARGFQAPRHGLRVGNRAASPARRAGRAPGRRPAAPGRRPHVAAVNPCPPATRSRWAPR